MPPGFTDGCKRYHPFQNPKIMKNFTSFFIATLAFFSFTFVAAANPANENPEDGHCIWDCFFKFPTTHNTYEEGKDVYVRVEPKKQEDIEFVELFVNGNFVRKEENYPFEWCVGQGNSDHHLRKIKQGKYKLKARIKDRCGNYREEYCEFEVKCHNGGGNYCEWKSWFKYPEAHQEYKEGDNVYVRVETEKYQDIEYMELYLNGKLVRKENNHPYEWCVGTGNSDPYLRNLKPGKYKLEVKIKDRCGNYHEIYCDFEVKGHGGHCQCEWESWFSFPDCNKTYAAGRDLYVKVDTKKHQDIEYMELFVNGQFVRKENSYPYEWCVSTGNTDSCLRKMRQGTYNLKVKIKDRCGNYHEEYCTVYVKDNYR